MRIRKRDHSALVARVKELLTNTAGLKVRLGDLAKAVGTSPSHLAAIFKKAEHTTIHRYLVDLRLRRAASLLWGCDDLTTLALNLGFASQSHFSNAFRRWAGCPPGQYRTRLRAFGVYELWKGKGVEFTQEPVERYGNIDAGFRDPSGNGWKMIQAR